MSKNGERTTGKVEMTAQQYYQELVAATHRLVNNVPVGREGIWDVQTPLLQPPFCVVVAVGAIACKLTTGFLDGVRMVDEPRTKTVQ